MSKIKISWKIGVVIIGVLVFTLMLSACGSAGENAGGNSGGNKISVNKSKLPKNKEDFYKVGNEYGYKPDRGKAGLKGSNTDNTACLYASKSDGAGYDSFNWYRVEYDSFESAKHDLEDYKSEYEKNNVKSEHDIYWKDLTYQENDETILWKTTFKLQELKYDNNHHPITDQNTNLYACLVDNVIYMTVIQYDSCGSSTEEWAIDNSFKLIGAMGLPEW